jgi:hypothetical protein
VRGRIPVLRNRGVTRALLDALGYGARLAAVPLDPPLHEAFAFIQRRNARLSPATRALMTLAEQHITDLSGRWPGERR